MRTCFVRDMPLLSDGRVLIVGGYGGSGSSIGIANAEIFDPSTNSWTKASQHVLQAMVSDCNYIVRWSGSRNRRMADHRTHECRNTGNLRSDDEHLDKTYNANNPFETYPFIYLLPNGTLVHVGGSEYATVTETLNLSTQTWTTVDGHIIDGGSSAMYLPGKIVKAGSATDSQNSGPSSSTTLCHRYDTEFAHVAADPINGLRA